MKKKKLVLPLLIVCFAMLMFGVYAAKNAKLNAGGSVGFNAHDCTLTMYGTITGAVSNMDNMVEDPQETFYFGDEDNQFDISGSGNDGTVLTFAEHLTNNVGVTQPVIYFNDAGNVIPPIVMRLDFTNTSKYPVLVDVTSLVSATGTTATVTKQLASIPAGASDYIIISIRLDDTTTDFATEENPPTNFSLVMDFKKQSYSVGLEYTLNDDQQSYYVAGRGTCTDTVIKIPPTYNGLPVTGIGPQAFKDATEVTKIILPETITKVEDEAFSGCTNLENVNIPQNAVVGNDIYKDCTSMKELTITSPDALSTQGAFKNNTNLFTVTIGKEVTSIGKNAFSGCTNLQTVIFEEGSKLQTIGDYAFYDCCSLQNFELPTPIEDTNQASLMGKTSFTSTSNKIGVKTIGNAAFASCYLLDDFYLPETVEIIYPLFLNDPYYHISKNSLRITNLDAFLKIRCLNEYGYASSNSIMENIDKLYLNGELVTDVKVSDNLLTTYNGYAFSHYKYLKSIEIPEGVTIIESDAFEECEGLEEITFPSTLKKIKSGAFYNCKLKEVTLPEGVETAYFSDCGTIKRFDLPSTIIEFGYTQEDNSEKMIINMPSINIWAKIGRIGSGKNIELRVNNQVVTDIVFDEGLTSIADEAFYGLTQIKSVTMPNSLLTIGKDAFYQCFNLVVLNLSNNIQTIGSQAFGYTDIFTVTIPETVTSYYYSFTNCKNLVEVINNSNVDFSTECSSTVQYVKSLKGKNEASAIEIIDGYVFFNDGTNNYLVNYIGNETDLVLPDYYNGESYIIYNQAFKTNSSLITPIDNVKSIIVGAGVSDIEDLTFNNAKSLEKVVLPNNLTIINYSVFSSCTNLKEVVLPSNLLTIDKSAFAACFSLEEIELPESLVTINDEAFYNCGSLKQINLPKSLTTINSRAFSGCYKLYKIINNSSIELEINTTYNGYVANYAKEIITLENNESRIFTLGDYKYHKSETNEITLVEYTGINANVVLPATIEGLTYKINYGLFYGNKTIKNVVIPEGIVRIEDETFKYSSVESVTLPSSLTYLGYSVFQNCESLKTITIPGSVNAIRQSTFEDCINLKNIIIENGVKTIERNAFYDCESLESIEFPNSVTTINDNAFTKCKKLTNVKLPTSITTFSYIFPLCYNLKKLEIPEGVKTINSSAFSQSYIEELWLPSTLTSCNATTSNTLKTVHLNSNIQIQLAKDKTLYVPYDLFDSIVASDYYSTSNIYTYLNQEKTLVKALLTTGEIRQFKDNTQLKEVIISKNSDYVSFFEFENCTNLETVTCQTGSSLGYIYFYAFKDCTKLKTVELLDNFKYLYSFAFYNCTSLTNINIPSSIKLIGDFALSGAKISNRIVVPNTITQNYKYAFINCILTEIYIYSDASYEFEIGNLKTIYVPAENVQAFKASAYWSQFNIQAIPAE